MRTQPSQVDTLSTVSPDLDTPRLVEGEATAIVQTELARRQIRASTTGEVDSCLETFLVGAYRTERDVTFTENYEGNGTWQVTMEFGLGALHWKVFETTKSVSTVKGDVLPGFLGC